MDPAEGKDTVDGLEGLIAASPEEPVADGDAAAAPVAAAPPALAPTAAGEAAAAVTAPVATVALPVADAGVVTTGALAGAAVVSTAAGVVLPPGVTAPVAIVRPPKPCRIDFEACTGTEPFRAEVRAWLDRLGDLTAAMTNAEVAIESVSEPRKDRMYRARIRLSMRAGVVVVPADHPQNAPHEDIYCAIRNAFRVARRELEGYLREHPAGDAPLPVAG